MKKLYLLAAAALTTMSLNAQLYVVGNGSGLTWDLPGTEIPANADGTYTLNLSACDQFKVSKVNSTAWDGDNGYNSGAFAPAGTHAFTDAVFNTGGETVATEPWGENISLPANGRYTITISADCSSMTAVANFAKPVDAPAVYLRGGMNNWNDLTDQWKFTYNSDNDSYSLFCTISAGVEFKIADATWGNINYTYAGSLDPTSEPTPWKYNNSANTTLSKDFTGTITFKIVTPRSEATVAFTEGSEDPNPKPDVDPNPSGKIYVMGNGEGLGWDFPGTVVEKGSDGNYTFTSNNLQKFKFSTVEAYEWEGDNGFNSGAYGTGGVLFSAAVANAGGETLPLEPWGEDQELPWTGNYTITIAGDLSTINAYTSTPKPTTAPDVYIRGGMNDWGVSDEWKFTYSNERGEYIFICEGATVLPKETEFKFADSNWGNINYGNGNVSIAPQETAWEEVLTKGGNNMALTEDFTGAIVLKIEETGAVATFKPNQTNGVGEVEVAEGEAVYFNLQGVKVANPEHGIFIKVANGKAEKVVL